MSEHMKKRKLRQPYDRLKGIAAGSLLKIRNMTGQRMRIIDGFRCIALIFVLLYHLSNPYVAHYPHKDFFLHFFEFGYLGVYFFFMVSGFVINRTLENIPGLSCCSHDHVTGICIRQRF